MNIYKQLENELIKQRECSICLRDRNDCKIKLECKQHTICFYCAHGLAIQSMQYNASARVPFYDLSIQCPLCGSTTKHFVDASLSQLEFEIGESREFRTRLSSLIKLNSTDSNDQNKCYKCEFQNCNQSFDNIRDFQSHLRQCCTNRYPCPLKPKNPKTNLIEPCKQLINPQPVNWADAHFCIYSSCEECSKDGGAFVFVDARELIKHQEKMDALDLQINQAHIIWNRLIHKRHNKLKTTKTDLYKTTVCHLINYVYAIEGLIESNLIGSIEFVTRMNNSIRVLQGVYWTSLYDDLQRSILDTCTPLSRKIHQLINSNIVRIQHAMTIYQEVEQFRTELYKIGPHDIIQYVILILKKRNDWNQLIDNFKTIEIEPIIIIDADQQNNIKLKLQAALEILHELTCSVAFRNHQFNRIKKPKVNETLL